MTYQDRVGVELRMGSVTIFRRGSFCIQDHRESGAEFFRRCVKESPIEIKPLMRTHAFDILPCHYEPIQAFTELVSRLGPARGEIEAWSCLHHVMWPQGFPISGNKLAVEDFKIGFFDALDNEIRNRTIRVYVEKTIDNPPPAG